ncbi:hypothetical protein CVT25_012258 [Psilocybe cyanescens]|uniref:Beta-lactamase-related domain-containing protein n=1 Tax=Psilocybe cyanescens TaxID=93625 RepID=A0A409XH72_PSICY|nr:hypothetical protein CVT25_012258 [Psilocybe cyanescens]
MVKLTSAGKDALDGLFEKASQEKKIPGFVFGVSNSDEEIYFKGTGYRVVNDPNSGEVVPDSVFWVCSQAKLIVHLAALRLIEQGKLKEDTPAFEFFPELANLVILDDTLSPSSSFRPATKPILVKNLLNFSSGLFYPPFLDLTRNMPSAYSHTYKGENSHSKFFQLLKGDFPGIPIKFEPGADFANGYSSDVLGFIVERVSGKDLEQHLQETIFAPLGLNASFYRSPKIIEREVTMTYRRADGTLEPWNDQIKLIERDAHKVSLFIGGAGIYSSLRSYLTLLRHIHQIHDGKITKGIINRGTAQKLFLPTLTEAGAKNVDLSVSAFPTGNQWSVALAVCTVDWPKRRKRGTIFWLGWAGSYYFIDPETGISAVFGTQLAPSADPEVIKLFCELEEALYAGLEE